MSIKKKHEPLEAKKLSDNSHDNCSNLEILPNLVCDNDNDDDDIDDNDEYDG